jgi:hypothetical protein
MRKTSLTEAFPDSKLVITEDFNVLEHVLYEYGVQYDKILAGKGVKTISKKRASNAIYQRHSL